MSLLFKQLYSRQGKKDAIRIAAGLVILAVFEIGLIRQAGIDESVLRKTYIILALLLMNTYMVFLSVTSQWKESYMKLSLPAADFFTEPFGSPRVSFCLSIPV